MLRRCLCVLKRSLCALRKSLCVLEKAKYKKYAPVVCEEEHIVQERTFGV